MKVTSKVHGTKTAEARIKGYAAQFSASALGQDVLEDAAEPIRERAAANAPRGATGTLQDNIIVGTRSTAHRVWKRTAASDRARVGVGPSSEAFYGMFHEIGTAHHPADPFLRPAVDSGRKAAIARYHAIMSARARAML